MSGSKFRISIEKEIVGSQVKEQIDRALVERAERQLWSIQEKIDVLSRRIDQLEIEHAQSNMKGVAFYLWDTDASECILTSNFYHAQSLQHLKEKRDILRLAMRLVETAGTSDELENSISAVYYYAELAEGEIRWRAIHTRISSSIETNINNECSYSPPEPPTYNRELCGDSLSHFQNCPQPPIPDATLGRTQNESLNLLSKGCFASRIPSQKPQEPIQGGLEWRILIESLRDALEVYRKVQVESLSDWSDYLANYPTFLRKIPNSWSVHCLFWLSFKKQSQKEALKMLSKRCFYYLLLSESEKRNENN